MTSGRSVHNQRAENASDKLWFGRGRRLPMIRQVERSECALACLGMILAFYGRPVPLSDVRAIAEGSLRGTTLTSLIATASIFQLVCRPVRLDMDEIGKLKLPCILHWSMDHFVVLKSVGRRHVVVHDPGFGIRRLSVEQLSEYFTGVAVELDPSAQFQRIPTPPPISLRKLAGPVTGLWRSLSHVFLMALALEAVALLMPQFIQAVLDQVVSNADADLLMLLGCGFVLLLLFQVSVAAMRTWTIQWISSHLNIQWTSNLFHHLMRLPQSYFLRRHTGDVVSRFGAISAVQQVVTSQAVAGLLDGLMAICTVAMLLLYSPSLAMIPVVAAMVYTGSRLLYFRVFREANLSQIVVNAKQQTALMESIRSAQTIRLANQVDMQTAKFANLSADSVNTSVAVQRYTMMFSAFNALVSGAQRLAIIWIGALSVLGGHLSSGMLMAFLAYADQFGNRASSFVDFMLQFRMLRLQTDRLADIALHPTESGLAGAYQGTVPDGSVDLNSVVFKYSEHDPLILKGCSMHVASGEMVAIVGPSGGGKSTLAKVLGGLLDPSLGDVAFGGIPLVKLGKQRMRDMVACVMQDDVLLSGTIAENISFFDESAQHDDIEDAAKKAGIHADINRMPLAYRTPVGDTGSAISGGQKQRVLLARALYRKPKVLILDEATSHLDVRLEQEVIKSLSSLAMTRIVIAHRPESIRAADRVFLLDGGMITELHRDGAPNAMESDTKSV